MKRRSVIIAAITAVAGFVLMTWISRHRPEPVYEGRTLSEWLNHHVPSSAARPAYGSPGWQKAHEAMIEIGTNGIPVLLEMMETRDAPLWVWNLANLANHWGLRITMRRAAERIEEAEYAFLYLNTNAASAVPGLIRIYERNISSISQNSAALALGHIGNPARDALPALLSNFTHTNQEVRFHAVSAVANIGGDPAVVVPALTAALRDSSPAVRWNALSGLSRFGRTASNSVPEILKMNPQTVGEGLPEQIATALWRIAPEKVGFPCVVEPQTPIAGTVTTQALKMEFFGQRKTLIPAGKPLPATGQYWNSDPRPSLKLYRGAPDHLTNDYFLGEFEVLDVGDDNSVNISTLIVITDGQIILNARDNTRKKFLPVRRKQNLRDKRDFPDTLTPAEPGWPQL